jgi:hypothetical protein
MLLEIHMSGFDCELCHNEDLGISRVSKIVQFAAEALRDLRAFVEELRNEGCEKDRPEHVISSIEIL